MSYDCPGGCLRLDYFSNPDIWYNGEPIGIAAPHPDSADNARTVDQTRITVAGFREEVQPFITVTSPDGETVWRRGRTYRIMWISSNLSGNVKVELFQGGILDTTINPGTPDTGSISYTVPFSQPLGSNYRIRVTSVESSDIFDESDGEFTIAEAPEIKAIPWIQLLLLED